MPRRETQQLQYTFRQHRGPLSQLPLVINKKVVAETEELQYVLRLYIGVYFITFHQLSIIKMRRGTEELQCALRLLRDSLSLAISYQYKSHGGKEKSYNIFLDHIGVHSLPIPSYQYKSPGWKQNSYNMLLDYVGIHSLTYFQLSIIKSRRKTKAAMCSQTTQCILTSA